MKYGNIIITNEGSVKVELSTDGTVWMDAHEIATLFNIKKAVTESNLRTLLRSNALWMETFTKEVIENISGKQCRIELFNLEIIIALSFMIDSYVCSIFRQWCVKQVVANQTKKSELFIQIGTSTLLN